MFNDPAGVWNIVAVLLPSIDIGIEPKNPIMLRPWSYS